MYIITEDTVLYESELDHNWIAVHHLFTFPTDTTMLLLSVRVGGGQCDVRVHQSAIGHPLLHHVGGHIPIIPAPIRLHFPLDGRFWRTTAGAQESHGHVFVFGVRGGCLLGCDGPRRDAWRCCKHSPPYMHVCVSYMGTSYRMHTE